MENISENNFAPVLRRYRLNTYSCDNLLWFEQGLWYGIKHKCVPALQGWQKTRPAVNTGFNRSILVDWSIEISVVI